MLGCLYALPYLICGVLIVRWLLPRHPVLNRGWLGLALGFLLLMTLPALCAFFWDFGFLAHGVAIIPLGLATLGAWLGRDKRAVPKAWDAEETRQARQAAWLVVPLTLLSIYLQITHVMRVDAWGNWNVGQSTYGDLPMHLSFITGLKNTKFPPEYPFYPGHRLTYPFLTDSLSTTFYLFGMSLQAAAIVPAVCLMALTYLGVVLLAREMTAGKKTILLAAAMFFLSGGLGFLYDFDQAAGYETAYLSDPFLRWLHGLFGGGAEVPTVLKRLDAILTGYYKTPTNQPEPNNLRWSNIIVDLLVPQRTLLGGYSMALPCFYLLYTAFDPRKRETRGGWRPVILLGLWAGCLPLIHTHSFLALGLCTAGMMGYDMIHDPERVRLLRQYAVYGALAVVLAAPQLIAFTFHQALGGQAGDGFLRLQFNWVNNPNGQGMRDFYLWFYIKNIGLPALLFLPALLERNPRERRLASGAFAILLAAELVRFQPNEYDNNKLLYLAFLLLCMIAADYAALLWRRLKGLRARPVLAAFAAVVMFLSGGLTIWRECVSDYQAFSAEAVEAGAYIRDNTEEHSVFLTGTQHLNPVDSIAGRRIVCGPDLWLYWHGFRETYVEHAEIEAFYADPAAHADVLQRHDVDYIYVSDAERQDYDVDEAALDALFERVWENDFAAIWKVPKG